MTDEEGNETKGLVTFEKVADGIYYMKEQNADGTSGAEPERVTVYEKGATVDTQGHTVHWTRPFLAPTGRRIKRIAITDSTLLQANYGIGPGIVRIESTSGAGASAKRRIKASASRS